MAVAIALGRPTNGNTMKTQTHCWCVYAQDITRPQVQSLYLGAFERRSEAVARAQEADSDEHAGYLVWVEWQGVRVWTSTWRAA